jgi:hypothetical protein
MYSVGNKSQLQDEINRPSETMRYHVKNKSGLLEEYKFRKNEIFYFSTH